MDNQQANPPPAPSLDQQLVTTFRSLDLTLSGLRDSYDTSTITNVVPPYDGDRSKCRDWITALEKYFELHNITIDSRKVQMAYMTARGTVSDFLKRWQAARIAPVTWPDAALALVSHFSTVTDSDHSYDLLKKITQGDNESHIFFAERIYKLSTDVFSREEMANPGSKALAERQLVNYFMDGLKDSNIKLKVMRGNPATLDDAVRIARSEHTIMQRFALRNPGHRFRHQHAGPRPNVRRDETDRGPRDDYRVEQPMEIDHIRPRHPRYQNARSNQNRYRREDRRANVHAVAEERKCYFCGAPGHFKRDCQKFKDTLHYQRPGNRNGPTQSGN